MENYSYTYSAPENQEVKAICSKYLPQEKTPVEQLRMLDQQASRPAKRFAYIFGTFSAIVMGAGMSLVMTDIGTTIGLVNGMVPGIAIGVVGLGMALLTYPIYKKKLLRRREIFAPKILELSKKIMEE